MASFKKLIIMIMRDENKTACFDKESKANILKDAFLIGAHLKDN